MRISRRGEYGLAAVMYIASKPSGIRSYRNEIANNCGIPKKYLARILCRLREAGILGAVRGANGGYFLRKEPKVLPLLDLVVALEGPVCFNSCTEPVSGDCSKLWTCKARKIFEALQVRSHEWLQGIMVGDLLPAKS